MLLSSQDAYGQQLYDYFTRKSQAIEIVERDDGFIQANLGPRTYLSDYDHWAPHEKSAIRYAAGNILDIGCGGGRHSLYLQRKGFEVQGIDVSPLAVKVCKLRGVKKALVMSIGQVRPGLGQFDTILMLGNGFGLFGSPAKAKRLLRRFLESTTPRARIISESLDPYNTTEPAHLSYHHLNRRRGRMAGQVRIRIRYKKYSTPWFDYLLVSRPEMKQIVQGTGWKIERFIVAKGRLASSRSQPYIAIITHE